MLLAHNAPRSYNIHPVKLRIDNEQKRPLRTLLTRLPNRTNLTTPSDRIILAAGTRNPALFLAMIIVDLIDRLTSFKGTGVLPLAL